MPFQEQRPSPSVISVLTRRQKETPAEGRGSKTSLESVTLFPPREAFSSHSKLLFPTGTVAVVGGRLVTWPQPTSGAQPAQQVMRQAIEHKGYDCGDRS